MPGNQRLREPRVSGDVKEDLLARIRYEDRRSDRPEVMNDWEDPDTQVAKHRLRGSAEGALSIGFPIKLQGHEAGPTESSARSWQDYSKAPPQDLAARARAEALRELAEGLRSLD